MYACQYVHVCVWVLCTHVHFSVCTRVHACLSPRNTISNAWTVYPNSSWRPQAWVILRAVVCREPQRERELLALAWILQPTNLFHRRPRAQLSPQFNCGSSSLARRHGNGAESEHAMGVWNMGGRVRKSHMATVWGRERERERESMREREREGVREREGDKERERVWEREREIKREGDKERERESGFKAHIRPQKASCAPGDGPVRGGSAGLCLVGF